MAPIRPADLDEAVVQGLVDIGGAELFTELVDDFVPFARTTLGTICDGAAAGDCAAIQAAAHSIKSASAALGATDLSALSAQLESSAKALDIATVRALVPSFERAAAASELALVARAER